MNEKYFIYKKQNIFEKKEKNIFGKIDKFWKISAYLSGVFIALFIILDGLIFTNTFDFPYATWKDFYLGSFDFSLSEILLFFAVLPILIVLFILLVPYLIVEWCFEKKILNTIKKDKYLFFVSIVILYFIFLLLFLIIVNKLYDYYHFAFIVDYITTIVFIFVFIDLIISLFLSKRIILSDKFNKKDIKDFNIIIILTLINIIIISLCNKLGDLLLIWFILSEFSSLLLYFLISFIEMKMINFKQKLSFNRFILILIIGCILFIPFSHFFINKDQWKQVYNLMKDSNITFKNGSFNIFLNPLFLQHNYKNIDVNISQYDFLNHPYKNCIYENNQTKFLDINSSAFILSLSQTHKLYFQKDKNGTCIYAIKVIPFKNQEFYKLVDIGYLQK